MAREGSEARKCVYHAAGSGIPEVKTILSGFVIRGFLGIKTLWVKTLALILSVASGLVVGQQGPLIHIACCAGNVLSRLFPKYARNDGKRREILSAAASAGVSVAFGAPIGGVLFSLEEVSYYFPLKTLWRSFFCALIAAITLKMFNPLGSGKLVLFQVSYDGDWHAFELVPFMVLGVLGGLYGHLFIAATTLWTRVRERTPIGRHPVWEVVGVAVLTGVFGYGNHYTRMGSSELVGILFGECKDEADLEGLCRPSIALTHLLLRTLLTKTLLTLLTFGLKIPGGIFIPSMAVGACAGRLMGLGVKAATEMYSDHWAFAACGRIEAGKECVIPGVYAMVGAVAALSGVTRMTVSLTIILFELTNSLLYVLPLMFTILVSKFTGDALSKNGLYDTVIERSGHPYLDAKRIFAGTGGEKRLEDVLEKPRAVVRCGRVYAVEEIEGMLAVMGHSRDGGFPVLEGDLLVGYVGCTELQHALDTTKTSPNPFSPITFRRAPPRWSLAECDPSVGCIVTPKPEGVGEGVHDFTPWMDQAPLSVPDTAPLDLVAELFVKLGVKMLCVVRDGRLVGVVNKKRLVAVLRGRDEGGL
ncbi:hypothetical protein HK104_010632 [Borealophlyctis nickersoniae]|nr:hypothetical protein HK104_010632 [Borealophlyctis nickersoniae]